MTTLLFYLFLLLLPTQLGYHFWPSWALVLGRRVDYLSPTLFFTDVLIILLLVSWFGESSFRIRNHESGIKKLSRYLIHNSKFLIPAVGFVGLNIFFASSWPVALLSWIKFLEFFLLGVYIVKTKPDLGRVTLFLSIGGAYSSLLAIAQFVLQRSVGGILWFLGERTFSAVTPGIAQIPLCFPGAVSCPLFLRPYATFPHPNVLGGYLAVVLPLILVSMRQRVNASEYKYLRIFFVMTFIMGIIALVLTFSRSAWVVGALAIALAIARIKNYEFRIQNKILFACMAVLTVLFVVLTIQYVQLTDESIVVRQQLAVAAVKIWQSAPILGVGLGNFLTALPRFLPSRTIYFLQPVHNIYLLLLSELGIVGLFLLLWCIVSIIKNYELRIKSKEIRKQPPRFLLLTSLFSILILGLIDHYLLTLQQGRLLLTIFISFSLV